MFAPRAPFSLNSPLAQMPPPNPPTSLECPTFMHAESHWLPLSKSTLYLPLIQPSPFVQCFFYFDEVFRFGGTFYVTHYQR